MALYVALPCLGLWGIGIPGAVWFLMSREREKLDTVATKQKFGFLYNGYKRDNYFWEIVLMYRKILCIFIAVFMNQIGVVVQALVILILLVFFLQLNNLRRPFASRNLNDTESMSLMTSIITIYCGIFYISSKDKTSASFNPNKDFSLDENGKMIFFCIIVLSNAMFLIFWVLKFVSIIRYLIKEKSLKLYVCLFLCCRQDKLDNENERIAKESKRETIIEKIEETQFFMKSMKNMYTRQIYYEGHQRFLKMLYYIEQEKPRINMTEKKHNFYIQGKMARDRKFDPERMKEILDQRILSIDEEFGGNPNGQRISNAMPQEEQENFSAQIFQQKLKASNANSIMPEEEFKRIGDDGQKLYARKRRSSMKKKFILDQTGSQSNLEETKDPSQLINELETDMNASRLDETNRFLIPQFSSKGVGRDIDFNVHQQEEDLEEQKKKEMLERQDIQTRLMRSRNADVKLNKSKQSRIFLDDVDDDEPSNEDATPKINDDFFNDGIGFVKEKVFASQESSQQSEEERKLMRQLTKRLEKNNDSKAKGIQQKLQGGKVSEQQLKRGKTKEYEVGHISQIQSPQDKQNHENNQSIKVLSQKQSQKLLTQEEALKLAEMSKEMRKKKLEYKEFLRPDGQLRRQIMIDNFCVIKETRGNPNKLQKISDVKLGQQQQKKRNEESENENEDEKQDNDDGEELKEEDSKLNVDLLTIDLLDDFEKAMKPSKQGKLTQKVLAKRKLKKLLTKVGRFYAGNYIPPKSSKSEDDSSTIKTDSSFGEYAKVFDEDKMILKTEPEQLVDMLEEADSPLTRMLKKQIKKKLVQSPIVNKFDTEESKH